MHQTLTEKILSRATGTKVLAGEIVYPEPDLITIHDWYVTNFDMAIRPFTNEESSGELKGSGSLAGKVGITEIPSHPVDTMEDLNKVRELFKSFDSRSPVICSTLCLNSSTSKSTLVRC